MYLLQLPSNDSEILLNTPNRNEILKEGPPNETNFNILGRGSYGTVFKAFYKGKQVAVKIVKNSTTKKFQTIRNEANIIGWKHRNIVEVIKIESTYDFGIVIMERFQGQCLQMIIDSIEIPLWHILNISMDLVSALIYCHRKNLLHLDVKPQNVLVEFCFSSVENFKHPTKEAARNQNYICKLCDFGSSMKIGMGNCQLSTRGTIRYMAPEALKGGSLEPSTDIYSLGISMWQLLRRQLPYYWIKFNEIVAYQVVKYNLRPDSKDTISRMITSHPKDHSDCLCEHYSSEISYRSLKAIKKMIISDGHSPRMISGKSKLFPRIGFNIPLKERLPSRSKVKRNLKSEFCGVSVNGTEEKMSSKNPSIYLDKHKLGILFFPDTFEHSLRQATEDSFKALYVSCWDGDQRMRPDSSEIYSKLKIMHTALKE